MGSIANTTDLYTNPEAKSYAYTYATDISLAQQFHQRLPGYQVTPLVPLPDLAKDLGVKAVFAKDESSRLGLPAFKILGASWGTFRAIVEKTGIPLDSTLEELASAAQNAGLTLLAATSGNHGRAIGYMARILGIRAKIFLSDDPDEQLIQRIASEGAEVIVVDGAYDDAVAECSRQTTETQGGLHVQDYAFEGYERIVAYVIEGYSTMMRELEQQLAEQGLKATHLVTPIGAGALGNAVVAHAKSNDRAITVIAAEPEKAACLNQNLWQGKLEPIVTTETIMRGMRSENVSPVSWPVLQKGIDISVTISDMQCHEAICYLWERDVNAGPCGAGTLAGLLKVAEVDPHTAELDEDSVIVLLSTEGKRYYKIPE